MGAKKSITTAYFDSVQLLFKHVTVTLKVCGASGVCDTSIHSTMTTTSVTYLISRLGCEVAAC